jgi:cyclophilin family peptidyl-prolyl cis-trans isomerase
MSVGQIQAPSAIELWWAKNRKPVLATLGLLVVALFGYYGLKQYRRVALDEEWGTFAANSGLQKGYVDEGPFADLVRSNPQNGQYLSIYLGMLKNDLVTKLGDHVRELDGPGLEQAIQAAAGTDRQPLLIWVAANRAYANRDFDAALLQLDRLTKDFPNHFLCKSSDYPPQYRRDTKEDKEKPATPPTKTEPPALTDAVSGSIASLMRERISRQREFVAANARLYEAPEPDSQQVAVFKTDAGEFKVAFYSSAAPRHFQSFVDLVKRNHFDGLAVDQIHRRPRAGLGESPAEMHVGLPATRQDDRTKWAEERAKVDGESVTAIEFENSGVSNFPFVVAATPGKDGKSLPGRIWITSADAAATKDGSRVVFGRVIEGQDVVRRIIEDTPFSTEDEASQGQGVPRDNIRLNTVEIVDR